MARPNATNHVVTRIREALKLTRSQFADRVGISPSYLRKIEEGRRPLTDQTIVQISWETCIPPDAIKSGNLSSMPGVENLEAIHKYYRSRLERSRLERVSMTDVNQHVSALAFRLELLLDAAVDTTPSRLNVAWYALRCAIDKVEKDLHLQKQSGKLKADYDQYFADNRCSTRLCADKGDALLDHSSLILEGESLVLKNKHRKEKFDQRAVPVTRVKKKRPLTKSEKAALDFATGLFNRARSSKTPKPQPRS